MSSGPWIENAMREVIRLFLLAGNITVGAITMAGNIILGSNSLRTALYSIADTAGGYLRFTRLTTDQGAALQLVNDGTATTTIIDFQEVSTANNAYCEVGFSSTDFRIYCQSGGATYRPVTIVTGLSAHEWRFATNGQLTPPAAILFNSAQRFVSAEITADGSAQATAHGLARTPSFAIAYFTLMTGGADAISAVTSDGTNCTVTATNLTKYRILAM